MCPSAEAAIDAAPHGGAYRDFPSAPAEFDAAQCGAALARLFRSAIAHAQDRIDWYDSKAGQQQRKAKSLRFWSIVFFVFGSMVGSSAANNFYTGGQKQATALGNLSSESTVAQLKQVGGEGILVTRIERLMP